MLEDPSLLTIGDFARAVGLPTSALRHYDECGLLTPARTDASTGYRYYTPALERRARLVALMREVGVPIDSMRRVLDGGTGQARGLLEGLVLEREQHAQRTRAALEAVLAALVSERVPQTARLRLDGAALAAALRQVRVAADIDAAGALACVLLDVRDGQVDVVATDRHWLARRTLPADAQVRGEARAVLRLPVVAELIERLEDVVEVDAVFSGGGLTLDVEQAPLQVDTSDRPSPSYRLILDGLDAPTTRVVVTREALVGAVTQARRAVITLDTSDGLTVAGAVVPAVVRGEPLTVGFRSPLLLRAAASCVGDRLVLTLSAPDRPAVLASPDQLGCAALVMPTLEPA